MAFSDRVPDALARALAAQGYTRLTPVQRAVLDVDPSTRDMLVGGYPALLRARRPRALAA